MGAQPYLSREEEGELVDFLVLLQNGIWKKQKGNFSASIQAILKKKGCDLGIPYLMVGGKDFWRDGLH